MLFIGAISAKHYEWHVCYKSQKQSFHVPHNKVDNLKTHGTVALTSKSHMVKKISQGDAHNQEMTDTQRQFRGLDSSQWEFCFPILQSPSKKKRKHSHKLLNLILFLGV